MTSRDGQPVRRRNRSPGASVDAATEDGRVFYEARIALFGKWFTIVAVAYYLLQNVPLDVLMGARDLDWAAEWFGFKERLQLVLVLVAAAMWRLPRWKRLSVAALQRIDGGGLFVSCALISAMPFELDVLGGQIFPVFLVLLGCTNLVAVRAIIIPSTVARTLVVSILAFLPALISITYRMLADPMIAPVQTAHFVVSALMWAAIATGSAVVTTRILFRLRDAVSSARRLGHYVLEGEIGKGAMGIVYRARHSTLQRPTAIKILSADSVRDVDLTRFEREVHWTAELRHPNTVEIYDCGRTPDGLFYCAMELVDGVTLEELVRGEGALPPGRVVHILRQVACVLAEAHQEGLIHRDVKPANLMICERNGRSDVAKVLDFGLVKEIRRLGADLSASGAIVGTPAYLSPEAIEDPRTIDARSDIYALGAVAYFLVTGTRLYGGHSAVSVCVQHLTAQPEAPSRRLGGAIPDDLEALILRCLDRAPGRRPDAAELIEALESCSCSADWTEADARLWWAAQRAETSPRPLTTALEPVTMSGPTVH